MPKRKKEREAGHISYTLETLHGSRYMVPHSDYVEAWIEEAQRYKQAGDREVASECLDIACSHYRFATELALKALDIASGRHPDFYNRGQNGHNLLKIFERNAMLSSKSSNHSVRIEAALHGFRDYTRYRYIRYREGSPPLRPSDNFGEESCQEHAEAAETVIGACQALIAGSDK